MNIPQVEKQSTGEAAASGQLPQYQPSSQSQYALTSMPSQAPGSSVIFHQNSAGNPDQQHSLLKAQENLIQSQIEVTNVMPIQSTAIVAL